MTGKPDLDEELALGEQDIKRMKREEDTRKLVMLQKDLLHQSNPLEAIIDAINGIDSFCKKGIIVLDEESVIKGMTRTAKRILGYRQKHGNPPCFNGSYLKLLYKEDDAIFKKHIEESKTGEETLQRIVVEHRESGRVHIRSRILGYNRTKKGALYGIMLGWEGKKLFGYPL